MSESEVHQTFLSRGLSGEPNIDKLINKRDKAQSKNTQNEKSNREKRIVQCIRQDKGADDEIECFSQIKMENRTEQNDSL